MVKAKLADIKALTVKFSEKEKLYLDKENDTYIEYYLKFSDKKINETLQELYETIQFCSDNQIDDFTDEYMQKYYHFLLIKHFTSLKPLLAKKDYTFHKEFMEELEENGLAKVFFDYTFDREEVYKALERYDEKYEIGIHIANELDKLNIEHLQGIKQVVN